MLTLWVVLLHAVLSTSASNSAHRGDQARRLSLTHSVQKATYIFRVRRNGQVDMEIRAEYSLDGNVSNDGQAPVWSNATTYCLPDEVNVSAVGQSLAFPMARVGNLSVVNFQLSNFSQLFLQPEVVATNRLTMSFQYSIMNGVCNMPEGGPKRIYFPWVNAWTSSANRFPRREIFRIEYPQEETPGVTVFVCFAADGLQRKCGDQMEISINGNWAQYKTDVALQNAFFEWDIPLSLSDVECPEKDTNAGRPVPATCERSMELIQNAIADAWASSASSLTIEGRDEQHSVHKNWNGVTAKKYLVVMCLVFSCCAVSIILSGCVTRQKTEGMQPGRNPNLGNPDFGLEDGVEDDAPPEPLSPSSPAFHPGMELSLEEDEPEEEVMAPPRKRDHVLFHVTQFFALWFGARRMDQTLDQNDIDIYAWSKMNGEERKKQLKKQFSRKTRQRKGRSKIMQPAAMPPGMSDMTPDDEMAPGEVLDIAASQAASQAASGSPRARAGTGVSARPSISKDEEVDVLILIKNQDIPWFIVTQTLVALVLWIIGAFISEENDQTYAGLETFAKHRTDLVLTRASAESCLDYRMELWRWLSYQYTHGSLTHVGMNSIANLIYGIPLEGSQGSLRLALLYNLGVFGGAACAVANDPHVAVVGMSGGCYTLMGIHLSDLVMNWYNKKYRYAILMLLMGLASSDLVTFVVSNDSISHSAHLGGYITGAIAGLIIGRNIHVERWEKVLSVFAAFFGVSMILFSFFWSVVQWPPRDIWEVVPWCWARQIVDGAGRAICIRCSDQVCIDRWHTAASLLKQPLYQVSVTACSDNGWYEV